jgi:hypothetical protein
MLDIAFRRRFVQKLYDSLFETVSTAYDMQFENLSIDNPPAVLVVESDAAQLMATTAQNSYSRRKSSKIWHRG